MRWWYSKIIWCWDTWVKMNRGEKKKSHPKYSFSILHLSKFFYGSKDWRIEKTGLHHWSILATECIRVPSWLQDSCKLFNSLEAFLLEAFLWEAFLLEAFLFIMEVTCKIIGNAWKNRESSLIHWLEKGATREGVLVSLTTEVDALLSSIRSAFDLALKKTKAFIAKQFAKGSQIEAGVIPLLKETQKPIN